VNLILFEPHELGIPVSRTDRRVQHLLGVLRRAIGDTFDAGVINGPRGKAKIISLTDDAATFAFTATSDATPAESITLLIGLPRPQTARDILRDATTLGVAALHFFRAEKTEASYAQSTLWSSDEWRRHVLAGAEQAFDTRIPTVVHHASLNAAISTFDCGELSHPPTNASIGADVRIALDNYESPQPLSSFPMTSRNSVVLALGPERGWSAGERELLRTHQFGLAHLGPRVLRAETAMVAAVSVVRAKLGLM
jgi:16S rRNA (uracil1498-N3)-methyltransferase